MGKIFFVRIHKSIFEALEFVAQNLAIQINSKIFPKEQ